MKKIILISGVFLLLTTQVTAQIKKEKQVTAATEALRNAMIDADQAQLEKLTAAKLSYGHSGGHVEGKAEFVEKIITGKSDFVTLDLTEQTVSVNGKTAVVRHILSAKTNDNGKPGAVQLRVLLVWQKMGGRWKLLARQAVKMAH